MWDQRYSSPEFVYGEKPNLFLADNLEQLATGSALCLAEGEGRNSVFLARNGFSVTAVDSSPVGLEKAKLLANKHRVELRTVVADLADYPIPHESVDSVVSIFCHIPRAIRKVVHKSVVAGLKPGGTLILEAYTPKQLEYKTGGPPTAELMMTLDDLRKEFTGLTFLHAKELDRNVTEGTLHTGIGAVVQIIAQKTSE